MRNKVFEKIASLFRKSEIEKQVTKSVRTRAIPEQEHSKRKGKGTFKERFGSLFRRRQALEKEQPAPVSEEDVSKVIHKEPIGSLPVEADVVIDNLRKAVFSLPPEVADMIDDAIDKHGKETVAKNIQDYADEIYHLIDKLHYVSGDSNQTTKQIKRLYSILNKVHALSWEEADKLSTLEEKLEAFSEYNELEEAVNRANLEAFRDGQIQYRDGKIYTK